MHSKHTDFLDSLLDADAVVNVVVAGSLVALAVCYAVTPWLTSERSALSLGVGIVLLRRQSRLAFKDRVKTITRRNQSVDVKKIVREKLNPYLRGRATTLEMGYKRQQPSEKRRSRYTNPDCLCQ
ncbi:hypothetical protein ACFPPD_22035 [Cohnella suwonensis]|uniref:Uncharacterized protein n=1 Tax=Cohnella suwonensis TaxID=696072 RepID=A0ABW0M2L7_9BACL